jgi:acetyl esterase/lipase
VAAVEWLKQHATEYGLGKMVLCGWSAGGNLALCTALKIGKSDLAAVLSFYPLLDFTQSREEKVRTYPVADEKSTTPKSWRSLYLNYVSTADDLSSPYLSPALATDEVLRSLSGRIALYSVEWDDLRQETEEFRKKLGALGKMVGGNCVEGAVHAWDKFPTYKKGDLKRDGMYADAINELRLMVGNQGRRLNSESSVAP